LWETHTKDVLDVREAGERTLVTRRLGLGVDSS